MSTEDLGVGVGLPPGDPIEDEPSVGSMSDGGDEYFTESEYSFASGESGGVNASRRILAEDEEWNMPVVLPLTELCVKVLVDNFVTHPVLTSLPAKFQEKVLHALPTTIPTAVAAPVITDENYWKRCCREKYENPDVALHGSSWKRTFFEMYITDLVERYNPDGMPLTSLVREFVVAQNHVFSLKIEQLPSHLDLGIVLSSLPHIHHVDLEYGVRDLGMEFEWGRFGATLADVRSLANAVSATDSITVLKLENSLIDDEKVRALAVGLLENDTITSLSLAHNKVRDRGGRALAKCLATEGCVLYSLNLSDNGIGPEGALAIGQALAINDSLQVLNLRLNRLHDKGGRALCAGLLSNKSVTDLNVSTNFLDEVESAKALGSMLKANTVLTSLDMSNNKIMSKLGKQFLREGVLDNTTLIDIDLRGTEIGKEDITQIEKQCKENAHRHGVTSRMIR